MARFSDQSVERVKEAADIVEIISAYTDLRRSGARFSGLCPFHDERTPSFSVDPQEKLYHCFGCGVGGDVIKFVEEKEGLAFPEAVEALADRYGVEIEREREDPRAEEARRRRGRLSEALERVASYYATFLWDSPQAAKAREYLASRGLGEEVLREFGVGFAPSAWDTVLTRAQAAGYTLPELVGAGLVQKGRKGGHYDRFRARIVFPVRDPRGRIQGFGARALRPDTKPKYVNSPESELYRKSRTLFGIDRARAAIARSGRAIVVEGYTDVLAAHQAGIEDAVGVMGTAITPEQLRLVSGYAEDVVLAMDADSAGRGAMLRAERVAAGRVRLAVAAMPEGRDPADLLQGGDEGERSRAADQFRRLVDGAVGLPEFHVRTLLDEADLESAAGRDRALEEVVPVLAATPDSITRDELMREVGDRLNADPGLVARRVAGGRSGAPREVGAEATREDGQPAPRPLGGGERRERKLLAMCIAAPAEGREVLGRLTAEHFSSPLAARGREWLLEHPDDPMEGLPRDDEELVTLMTQLVMEAEREPSSRQALELNALQLEQRLVERRIAAAGEEEDPPVDLQRERAALAQRIAHWEARAT